jgi:hypothetical protein
VTFTYEGVRARFGHLFLLLAGTAPTNQGDPTLLVRGSFSCHTSRNTQLDSFSSERK